MRKYKSESELKEIAALHSQNIAVRTYENGCSKDSWKKATKKQREILYGLIYGALLGLNWGDKCRSTKEMEQAIIDATEFQAMILLRPYMKDGEEAQCYDCVYTPLQKIVRAWEQE